MSHPYRDNEVAMPKPYEVEFRGTIWLTGPPPSDTSDEANFIIQELEKFLEEILVVNGYEINRRRAIALDIR